MGTWHGTWHLRWHRRHHACGIVKLADNEEKRLYVLGGYHGGWRRWVTYMRLSDMSGFHHESDLPHNIHSHEMRFVRTDPYHFMLVGGETIHWKGRSTRTYGSSLLKPTCCTPTITLLLWLCLCARPG